MGQLLMTKGCTASGIALDALNNPCMKEALRGLPSASHLPNHITPITNEEVKISNNVLGVE